MGFLMEEIKKNFSYQQTTRPFLSASVKTKATGMKPLLYELQRRRSQTQKKRRSVIKVTYSSTDDIKTLFSGKLIAKFQY